MENTVIKEKRVKKVTLCSNQQAAWLVPCTHLYHWTAEITPIYGLDIPVPPVWVWDNFPLLLAEFCALLACFYLNACLKCIHFADSHRRGHWKWLPRRYRNR